jgi:hypothetical protein
MADHSAWKSPPQPPSYLGGTRGRFACPVTGARCQTLKLVEGRRISRRAVRAAYPSQRCSEAERRGT